MTYPDPNMRQADILIADDSPTQAKLLEHILTEQGYRVTVARNGREAIDLIGVAKPDLIISDIMMPEITGFELCSHIRASEITRDIPIILLTLLDDPADVLRSLAAGANYFISKPYDNESLLSRVHRTLYCDEFNRQREDEGEVEIGYRGQKYAIRAGRSRIIDLLLATYETAVEKNQELFKAKNALRILNQELEKRVEERTTALMAETTERLRAMEELRRKDELLMQQSRLAAMGEMVGNIAHQWRQPLNIVGLLVQDLAICFEQGGLHKEYLDDATAKIMELIRHMSRTIDDFRNFFRPDREKVPFRLSEVVARTLSLVEGNFSSRQINVEILRVDDPEVNGYPNEYSQVLLNILSNAMDALQETDTTNPRLVVRVFTENQKAVVTITDNAGGVPVEIIGRIFEPYFTTKEQGKGTGVGLYMAKNIIEKNMHGSLTVKNTGHGAEFRIEV